MSDTLTLENLKSGSRPCRKCKGAGQERYIPGSRIQALREEAGLPQAETARRMGCSLIHYRSMERNERRITDESAAAFLAALEVGK